MKPVSKAQNVAALPETRPIEMRKQISLFIPLSDWKALRQEAARQQVPMTELCRRWMRPEMERLRQPPTVE